MRVFLDTNFLLDCVLPGRPEHGAAQMTKGLVDVGLIEGVVSACSLKDAYFILTKQTGEACAREVVRDCLKSYSVEPLDQEACFTSAYSDEPDFEDGCIRAMAERAGVGDAVREITARAMRGEIDFRESFTERVALLKGLDVSVMEEIARNLPITEGLERMMTILKRVGYKTAILSGGFTYFGNYLRQKYGFDYVYANELEIEQGKLTGRYVGEVVDGRRKAELLRLLCQFEEINIAQSVAVCDGANDLPMLNLAGLGIAFHAKPKVKATARQSISTIGLDGILYFLGLKDSRIEQ